jgi:hypothetical protein
MKEFVQAGISNVYARKVLQFSERNLILNPVFFFRMYGFFTKIFLSSIYALINNLRKLLKQSISKQYFQKQQHRRR